MNTLLPLLLAAISIVTALWYLPPPVRFAYGSAGGTKVIQKIRQSFRLPQNWNETIVDLTQPGEHSEEIKNTGNLSDEQLNKIVDRAITRRSAIDLARKNAFGGGLMKSLTENEPGSKKKLREFFDFLNYLELNDGAGIRSLQNKWKEEYKSLLTDEEYKTLDPSVEGTTTKGGYLVPPEFAADLARILGEYGFARQYCRTWQMASNILNVQALNAKPSVAFVAENAAIAASAPTIARTAITAKKIGGIWIGSNELIADANIDVYNAILELFGEQFALTEDTNVFANANTNWTGLLYLAGTAATATIVVRGNSTTSGLTGYPQIGDSADSTKDILSDMLRMATAAINMAFTRDAKFYMPQECLGAILGLRDSSKRIMLDLQASGLSITTGFNGSPKLFFHGWEIVPLPSGVMNTYDASAHATTPFMLFGNLKRAWATLGIRGGFEILNLQEGTVDGVSLATNDLRGLRMTERLAFDTALPAFIVGLRTSTT